MKSSVCVISAILYILSAINSFGVAQNDTLRGDVQALLDSTAAAFDRKDAEGVAGTAVQDATLEYLGGNTISIGEWKTRSSKEFAQIDTTQTSFTIETVKMNGDGATVLYTENHDYGLVSDKGHRYKSTSTWQATLVKTDAGWRFKNFKELTEQVTRDGAPYNPASIDAKP